MKGWGVKKPSLIYCFAAKVWRKLSSIVCQKRRVTYRTLMHLQTTLYTLHHKCQHHTHKTYMGANGHVMSHDLFPMVPPLARAAFLFISFVP